MLVYRELAMIQSLDALRAHVVRAFVTMPDPIVVAAPAHLAHIAAISVVVVVHVHFLHQTTITDRSIIFTRKCLLLQIRQWLQRENLQTEQCSVEGRWHI